MARKITLASFSGEWDHPLRREMERFAEMQRSLVPRNPLYEEIEKLSASRAVIDSSALYKDYIASANLWKNHLVQETAPLGRFQDATKSLFAESLLDRLQRDRITYENLTQHVVATIPGANTLETLRTLTERTGAFELLRALRTVASEAALEPVEFMDDTAVTIAGEQIALGEITQHASELVRSLSGPPVPERRAAYVESVRAFIARLPRKVAAGVLTILCFLLVAVLENEVQYYSGELLAPVRKVILNRLRTFIHETVPEEHIQELRVVVARSGLVVRTLPRRSASPIVVKLPFGTVVRIIRAQRDWVLIAHGEGESLVQGWVYARYLGKVH